MTLADLVTAVEASGIRLSLRLVVDAPAGIVGPEIRDALRQHKPHLLVRLASEAQWQASRATRWGPAVGDPEEGVNVRAPDPTGREGRLASILAAAPRDHYAVAERAALIEEGGDHGQGH